MRHFELKAMHLSLRTQVPQKGKPYHGNINPLNKQFIKKLPLAALSAFVCIQKSPIVDVVSLQQLLGMLVKVMRSCNMPKFSD